MIRTFLMHMIFEQCIDAFFEGVENNLFPSSRGLLIRKTIFEYLEARHKCGIIKDLAAISGIDPETELLAGILYKNSVSKENRYEWVREMLWLIKNDSRVKDFF